MKIRYFILPLLLVGLLVGCDDLFGSKKDSTTDEIFEAGRNEPGLISEVEYVPLFPFFELGADGAPFDSPQDVYVGYDEFIYVVDARGLHVLDLSGRPALFIAIPAGGGTSVIQDRKLDVYVTARRDTTLNGQTWRLPVVMHFSGLTTGNPQLDNLIWHPFDDDSRKFNRPDPLVTDEQVEFTGVGVINNNRIYVSRRGPINDRTSVILPHNAILEFTVDGINVQAIGVLDPNRESLRSAIYPTDVTTFVHPPQRDFFGSPLENKELILAQSSDPDGDGPLPAGAPIRFSVLSIITVLTSDGLEYRPDTDKLTITANEARGDGFLYDEFRFQHPSDIMFAADGSNYIFVLDSAKDSLFTFTSAGVEGVAPPPGSRSTKPVIVSFGGNGDGAGQFRNPQGVGYFNRIVYVADTGNNRLSRFRLNTDFE
ncbi:MAG: hypothetical protein ACI80V_002671 [Rhodothermales bacterium]